jgi:hypothetical protein
MLQRFKSANALQATNCYLLLRIMQNVYVNEMYEPIPTSLPLKQMARECNTELLNVT